MKRHLLFSLLFALITLFTVAQSKPYNVVFDLTSKDTNDHKSVIRWLHEISAERPDAKLEVVLYGKSLGMATKENSLVAKDIQDLSANKNVTFKVCAIAMKNNHIDKSQLLPQFQIVPDGIYEIISKQAEGFGYIKVAH